MRLYFIIDGEIYSFGSNNNGELGIGGSPPTYKAIPTLISDLSGETCSKISAGGTASLALTGTSKHEFRK